MRVLTGLGGSGKTTVALAVAEPVASDGVRIVAVEPRFRLRLEVAGWAAW
jgi:catechol 2,3-dioxygenase-like lactoylglutathione lyase family enzyme